MSTKDRPACYNRPDYQDSMRKQDGWVDVVVHDLQTGKDIPTRVPRMVDIPFAMSNRCMQNDPPFGEAYIHGWNCEGCSQYDRA